MVRHDDYLALQAKVVDDTSASLAEHAFTMSIVYHREGVILLCQLDNLWQPSQRVSNSALCVCSSRT